jgi:hypothetical protein
VPVSEQLAELHRQKEHVEALLRNDYMNVIDDEVLQSIRDHTRQLTAIRAQICALEDRDENCNIPVPPQPPIVRNPDFEVEIPAAPFHRDRAKCEASSVGVACPQ